MASAMGQMLCMGLLWWCCILFCARNGFRAGAERGRGGAGLVGGCQLGCTLFVVGGVEAEAEAKPSSAHTHTPTPTHSQPPLQSPSDCQPTLNLIPLMPSRLIISRQANHALITEYKSGAGATSLWEQVLVSDLNPSPKLDPGTTSGMRSLMAQVREVRVGRSAKEIASVILKPQPLALLRPRSPWALATPLPSALLFANPSLSHQHTRCMRQHLCTPATACFTAFSYLCGVDATSDLLRHVTSELLATLESETRTVEIVTFPRATRGAGLPCGWLWICG